MWLRTSALALRADPATGGAP